MAKRYVCVCVCLFPDEGCFFTVYVRIKIKFCKTLFLKLKLYNNYILKTTSHDSRPLVLTLLYPPSSPSSFFSLVYNLRLPCPFICTNIKSSTTRSSSAMTTCHRNVVSLYTVKRPYEYVPSADK